MQEIRGAALAYYANLSEDKKQLAKNFFNSMDRNGDGQISLQEYVNYLKENNKTICTNPSIFKALDKDSNGGLDFEETIILYYILTSERAMFCDCCSSLLTGIHFSCLQCYCSDSGNTYNLCCDCYGGKKFGHHDDATFYDNCALLHTTRSIVQTAPAEIKTEVNQTLAKMVDVASKATGVASKATGAATTFCGLM